MEWEFTEARDIETTLNSENKKNPRNFHSEGLNFSR